MFLTILTPTFNRASTLERLFESLNTQFNQSFIWKVIDDGSTDNTQEIVFEMQRRANFKIEYHYKENGGKHSAVNLGVNRIESPLVFIVDSDDFLTSDAVEIIFQYWNNYKENKEVGSFWFLMKNNNNQIIGDVFPHEDIVSSYQDIMINKMIKGDKKAVYITEARKKYPFPIIKNEKFIGESTIHMAISKEYKSVFINKAIYVAEYLAGGLTDSGLSLRINNPLGGMINSKTFFSKGVHKKIYIKKKILFGTYGFFANKNVKEILIEGGQGFRNLKYIPISYLLYLKWKKFESKS